MGTNQNDSSIISEFQLLNYKIDNIQFTVSPCISALLSHNLNANESQIKFTIRDAHKFVQDGKKYYVSGVNTDIYIIDNNIQIANGLFGIGGVFRIETQGNEKNELSMVKFQFPAILFAYLRSAITNTLASAGFGSFIFPLLNVYNLAKHQDEKQKIKIIEIENTSSI
jgi:Preprotein translocase subunit SecB.